MTDDLSAARGAIHGFALGLLAWGLILGGLYVWLL